MIALELSKMNFVRFYEKNHKYKNLETDKFMTSVTTFLGDLKQKFDKRYWLLYKALQKAGYDTRAGHIVVEYGDKKVTLEQHSDALEKLVTPEVKEYVRGLEEEWKYKNYFSTEKGSALHQYIESYYAGKIVKPKFNDTLKPKYDLPDIKWALYTLAKQFHVFAKDYSHLVPVASEVVVGDKDLGIAGQFDQLFYNRETDNLELYDWKTNKAIKEHNKFDKLKSPIDHLDDCNLNHYFLQLNLYKAVLEANTSLRIDKMNIVWFYEKNPHYVHYEVPDLSIEISELLSQHNLNLQ